ncbi:hypothetical protein PS723_05760 [Pseudomonas fluorescens]|uniref:Uncharacterized protein n=1 Tax=Pseudomonas fluorescens TaxID=294 RepID=A0A5E7FLN4_PSEFL|nr:hypothetical protein PS723_05760 [Pseudomonas fluorescens]
MRDGRVTQQTLEVALGQRQQVTEQDRRDGDNGQYVAQDTAVGHWRDLEQPHHHREHCDFRRRRQERRHGCRSTFVDVRGPEVEGYQRQLERQADQHHGQAQLRDRVRQTGSGQCLADAAEAHAAGFCVKQRHAEQQERRAGGRQHHVLDAGFQRTLVEEGIGHQAVDRYRKQFQTDEQAGQVLRADQYQATGRSHQDQQVQLFAVARVTRTAIAEVGVGEGYTRQRGDQDQRHVEAGEAIDLQQWSHDQRRDFQGREDR